MLLAHLSSMVLSVTCSAHWPGTTALGTLCVMVTGLECVWRDTMDWKQTVRIVYLWKDAVSVNL